MILHLTCSVVGVASRQGANDHYTLLAFVFSVCYYYFSFVLITNCPDLCHCIDTKLLNYQPVYYMSKPGGSLLS